MLSIRNLIRGGGGGDCREHIWLSTLLEGFFQFFSQWFSTLLEGFFQFFFSMIFNSVGRFYSVFSQWFSMLLEGFINYQWLKMVLGGFPMILNFVGRSFHNFDDFGNAFQLCQKIFSIISMILKKFSIFVIFLLINLSSVRVEGEWTVCKQWSVEV